MKLLRYLTVALESVLAHKLRSILTMLGVIIGVASVTTIVSVGRGAEDAVTSGIEGEGTNLLFVSPGYTVVNTLTLGDFKLLEDPTLHPEITAIVPEYTDYAQLVFEDESVEARITGTEAHYGQVRNLQMGKGRFLSEEDVALQRHVAILSAHTATKLFSSSDPIGQQVRIRDEPFRVIGVLSQSGYASDAGEATVYMPIDIAQKRIFNAPRYRGDYTITEITIQVESREKLKVAEVEVEQTMRLRHGLTADDENDFLIFNQARMLALVTQLTGVLTVFLSSIGAISLLVGGIGIMNIMLVSVTERTKEIGLRKALGARDRDILLQFLMEALLLTLLGGILGMLMSYGILRIMDLIPQFPFAPIIELDVVAMALCVSLACGFVFGLYPAIRATRLDPIDALRFE